MFCLLLHGLSSLGFRGLTLVRQALDLHHILNNWQKIFLSFFYSFYFKGFYNSGGSERLCEIKKTGVNRSVWNLRSTRGGIFNSPEAKARQLIWKPRGIFTFLLWPTYRVSLRVSFFSFILKLKQRQFIIVRIERQPDSRHTISVP